METIDEKFMGDLEKARNLLPLIQRRLNEPGYIPDNLDSPGDQSSIDNLFTFGSELAKLSMEFSKLATQLCVGMTVQNIYDELRKDEEEDGMDYWEKMGELGLKDSDF